MFGVYKVLKNGSHVYVSRTVTHSEALAKSIAADFTRGEIVMPDGSTRHVQPHPHIAKPIGETAKQA